MVKYWCKSPCVWSTVKTKEADIEESNGRVSIRDHPANLTFTVTLENLTEGDAGTYWCGIVTSWLPGYFLDPTFLVVVSVTPGCFSIQGPRSVRGLEGGSVSVQCNYTADWKTYEKWWCRGADWTSCQILVQTNGSEQVMKRDRVSIKDNQSHLLFTVTMEDVRQDDTDTYWCGISRHGPDLGTSIKVTIDPVGMILSTWVSPLSRTTTSGRAGAPSDSYIRHHYILLVFLKVPILLALVGAVLWLKGPQQRPSIYMNLSSDLVRDTVP
ncbi:CMRF35-like molecule 7 isoform X3 [Eumetopias jubatus]|nr:CMRF35-like molecule 7 isoform X3 [Eumetopias jubatus]